MEYFLQSPQQAQGKELEMAYSKAKILVVDDEQTIRSSMAMILTQIGYQVRSAADGFSALIEMRSEIPDLLVSDLNMPGMSGFELLSVVRRRFPGINVIAMSGAFSGDEVPSGVAADAFYEKGSSVDALLHMIESLPWLERRAFRSSPARGPVLFTANGEKASGSETSPASGPEIRCPECLRTFTVPLDNVARQFDESTCIDCRCSIHFAVRPAASATMLPFERVHPAGELSLRGMEKSIQ
jgi:CheY-like chemotaxis protein